MSGRYLLRVLGCQMNQHDAEKIANLLCHDGYRPTSSTDDADVILVHTCSVRDKAEQKLYSELGALSDLKAVRPDLLIGVGGCVAQQEGGRLLSRFPRLDFAFGSQNIRHLPGMLDAARARRRSLRVDWEADAQARFELPERHPEFASPTPGRAFVTVMEGCDLFCSFCVVPRVPGIERVRFTSPHPVFVSDDLIEAYASVPELCPHIHLPVQSGSSRVLAAMNRRYDRGQYLSIVERLLGSRPDLSITTDLIVGFPGETDEDFEETLSLCRTVQFVDSYSFKYSPRPGTPALRRHPEPAEPATAQRRLVALQDLQRDLTLEAHRRRIGQRARVLVEGPSRRGGGQRTGRCAYNRVVNVLPAPPGAALTAPGTFVEVRITAATPHSLLAEVESAATGTELPLV
jgi:tRNA-2-methylthio-N6-dimethylallyladenosine synthase